MNPAVWDDPEEFKPERFPLDGPVPNEQNTDYRYIPFSAGPRCDLLPHSCARSMFRRLTSFNEQNTDCHYIPFRRGPGELPPSMQRRSRDCKQAHPL